MSDAPVGRPAGGPGHYLRDVVFGANDGVITTMAVVSAVAGADLSARVALILGVANLVADGFSMGVGNYLSLKSELLQRRVPVREEKPWRHGAATAFAFALAGGLPLLAFAIPGLGGDARFTIAAFLAGVALVAVGAWRAPFVRGTRLASAAEVLLIGALAAGAAYAVGALAETLIA